MAPRPHETLRAALAPLTYVVTIRNTLHRENVSHVHQNQLRPKSVHALHRPELFCLIALGVTFVYNTSLHQKFEFAGRPNVRTTNT